MQLPQRSVVQSAFLFVGFLALLGIVGMTFWLGERAQVHFGEVIEARDTRGSAVELRNAVLTAESSQRGFLFTGNEIYLAPYDSAKTQAERQLDALKRLLQPYSTSDIAVQRLTEIIAEKFEEMDSTIALKRERRDDEVQAIVRTNRGKALMDQANVFFSGIIRAADARLTAGVEEQHTNARWLRTFSIVGAIVIVAMVGAAATSLLLYMRELRSARDEVTALNAALEQRVADRTADLAQANEEIKRFAHIVSHDLRAPLINIMGFTSEIEHSLRDAAMLSGAEPAAAGDTPGPASLGEELAEAIGYIRSSVGRMDRLISAILKLSREGRRELQREPVDLAEVIQTSVDAVRHRLLEADGEIELALAAPPMLTDRLSLEQIFGNLLDNAVKYRAAGRPLRIGVRAWPERENRVGIEISDNGRGIAAEDQERVFDLFRRAGEEDQPGEGLGLAYVRAMVRNLGGEVALTSAPGKGTTFRLVLPREMQAVAENVKGRAG
jgi:signal transduction histidine kinase